MDEPTPKLNVDAISEWSKWATGLSLFSATGCVGVLLGPGVKEANLPNIQTAIVCFLTTVVIAWGVQLIAALLKRSYAENASRHAVLWSVLWFLVIAEVLAFALAIVFLSTWILNLKAKEEAVVEYVKILSPDNGFAVEGQDTVFVVGTYNKSKDANKVVQCWLITPQRMVPLENKNQPDGSGIFFTSIPASLFGRTLNPILYLTLYNKKENRTVLFDYRVLENKVPVSQNPSVNLNPVPKNKLKPKTSSNNPQSGY